MRGAEEEDSTCGLSLFPQLWAGLSGLPGLRVGLKGLGGGQVEEAPPRTVEWWVVGPQLGSATRGLT